MKRGLLTVIKLAQWAAGAARGCSIIAIMQIVFKQKLCVCHKRDRERLRGMGKEVVRGSFITGGDDRKAQARIKHAGCEPLVTSAPSSPPLFPRSRAARQQSTHSTAFNERCVSGQLGVVAYTLTWLLFFPGLPVVPLGTSYPSSVSCSTSNLHKFSCFCAINYNCFS